MATLQRGPAMTRPETMIVRIADDLRRKILGGDFGDGALPTEAQLGAEWNTSKITIRGVYATLISEGLVVSQPRRGYFVHKIQPITLEIDRYELGAHAAARDGLDQWESAVAEQGRVPRTDVHVVVLDETDPMRGRVRELLGLAGQPSVQVVIRRRECYVDDVPWMTRDSYFPEPLARGTILMAPGDQVAPGGLLAAVGKAAKQWRDQWRGRMPTQEETRRLALPQTTPGIHWIRTRLAADGSPLAVMSAFLPGDRVQLADTIAAA